VLHQLITSRSPLTAIRGPIKPIIFSATVLAISGCMTLTKIDGPCGTGEYATTCMGVIHVPVDETKSFVEAGTKAIDVVNGKEFETALAEFATLVAPNSAHAAAWKGVEVSQLAAGIRQRMKGLEIETYGHLHNWFKYAFAGNLAYDGVLDGPIRLNRWGLPRDPASIANTIAHEAAHRAGAIHPSSDEELETALCEPPYVVGSLVELLLTATTAPSGHCPSVYDVMDRAPSSEHAAGPQTLFKSVRR
jgi:hypothetical protein